MVESEIPKHKKKTDSSTSKSNKKSKHKHTYTDCLFLYPFKFSHSYHSYYPCKGTYCTLCGKIGDTKYWETKRLDDGSYRTLSDEEIYEKYKDLEQIKIEISQKYVPLNLS